VGREQRAPSLSQRRQPRATPLLLSRTPCSEAACESQNRDFEILAKLVVVEYGRLLRAFAANAEASEAFCAQYGQEGILRYFQSGVEGLTNLKAHYHGVMRK
jgi:hypothetical protein